MKNWTRIITAAVVLIAMAASASRAGQPVKQWVWLAKQGVWGYGYQIQDGPHRGLWRIDPDSKQSAPRICCRRPTPMASPRS